MSKFQTISDIHSNLLVGRILQCPRCSYKTKDYLALYQHAVTIHQETSISALDKLQEELNLEKFMQWAEVKFKTESWPCSSCNYIEHDNNLMMYSHMLDKHKQILGRLLAETEKELFVAKESVLLECTILFVHQKNRQKKKLHIESTLYAIENEIDKIKCFLISQTYSEKKDSINVTITKCQTDFSEKPKYLFLRRTDFSERSKYLFLRKNPIETSVNSIINCCKSESPTKKQVFRLFRETDFSKKPKYLFLQKNPPPL